MSKWKCDICKKEFDNFHAQGFDNKIYCPLCFFKEKTIRLENRINKAVELLKEFYETGNIPLNNISKAYYELKGDKE